jgi:hypothetical protein
MKGGAMDFYEAFGLEVELQQAIVAIEPLLKTASAHGFTRDAELTRKMLECREALSKALNETASERDLRQAIEHVNGIGPMLLAAVHPGGRA